MTSKDEVISLFTEIEFTRGLVNRQANYNDEVVFFFILCVFNIISHGCDGLSLPLMEFG